MYARACKKNLRLDVLRTEEGTPLAKYLGVSGVQLATIHDDNLDYASPGRDCRWLDFVSLHCSAELLRIMHFTLTRTTMFN